MTRASGTLAALRRGLDAWFLVALAVTALLALALAAWLSRLESAARCASSPTRPRRSTSTGWTRTSPRERADEIGALSRLLGAMTAGSAPARPGSARRSAGSRWATWPAR